METVEKAYSDLVLRNHTWVNPFLRKFDNPIFSGSYFVVDLVDFVEIISTPRVRIVYVRKRPSAVIDTVYFVYCHLV